MLTFLAFVGRLAWPLLGSLVPGMSPRLLMVLAGALAALVAVGGPAGAVWLHMNGKASAADKAASVACELRVAIGSRVSAEKLAQVLATVNALPDEAEGMTRAEACKRDRFCKPGGTK